MTRSSSSGCAAALAVGFLLTSCGRSNLEPDGIARPTHRGEVLALEFSPSELSLRAGETAPLRLLGRTASRELDLSRDPAVLFESTEGVLRYEGGALHGLARGEGTVVARRGELTAVARVEVRLEREVTALRIEPAELEVHVGELVTFRVEAVHGDGTTHEVTELPGTTLQVDGEGAAALEGLALRGLSPGSAILIAERQGRRAEAIVRVDRDRQDLVRLEVAPLAVLLAPDDALQLSVTGFYAGGASEELTAEREGTRYRVANPGVLLAAGDGLFFGDAEGSTTIEVSHGLLRAEVRAEVRGSGPRLARLEVIPDRVQGYLGDAAALRVVGRYDDGSTAELSAAVTGTRYQVSDGEVISVSADGVLAFQALGTAVVRVTQGRFAAIVPVEVVLPPIVGFALVPDFDIVTAGETGSIRALATFEDGSVGDVSCYSSYESSDSSVVAAGGCGTIQGLTPGEGVITATAPDGVASAASRVSVRDRRIVGLGVSQHTVRVGEEFTARVWLSFDDGTEEDVTRDPETTWVVLDEGIVEGVPPTFTAIAPGSAELNVHYRDQRAQLFVHVLATPPGLTVRAGETLVVESFQQDLGAVVVERGGTLRFEGRSAAIIADSIRIDGRLELLAGAGVDGFTVAAPGGRGAPGGAGGGAGADGDSQIAAAGGAGDPPGGAAAPGAGAGTPAGAGGGGDRGGSGAAGGCAQGGGGGGNAGPGGAGGGDAGPGTGASGGAVPLRIETGGGGGGGGSTCGTSSGGGGGGGGGHLFLRAASIEVSGTIAADGAPGGAGYSGTGAGGGGAGGWVELDTSGGSLVISGNVSVRGGAGGGSTDGDAGGGGGGGQLSLLAGGTVDVGGALLQVAGGPGGSATAGGFDGIAGGEGVVALP